MFSRIRPLVVVLPRLQTLGPRATEIKGRYIPCPRPKNVEARMYPRKDPLYRNIGLHYLSANTVNANYCPPLA